MTTTFYLSDPQTLQNLQRYAASGGEDSFAETLRRLVHTEFRTQQDWFTSEYRFMSISEEYYNLIRVFKRIHGPRGDYPWDYLLVVHFPHQYGFGKHRRFTDDAREAILQVMTLSFDNDVSDQYVMVMAVSELYAEFWVWTGRGDGPPKLRRLTVERAGKERALGLLHLIEDGGRVHEVFDFIKETESALMNGEEDEEEEEGG